MTLSYYGLVLQLKTHALYGTSKAISVLCRVLHSSGFSPRPAPDVVTTTFPHGDSAKRKPKGLHLYMEKAFLLSRFCRVNSTEVRQYCLEEKNLIGTGCAAGERQRPSAHVFRFFMPEPQA